MTELQFLPRGGGVSCGFDQATGPTDIRGAQNQTSRHLSNFQIKVLASAANFDQPKQILWRLGHDKRTSQQVMASRHHNQMATNQKPTSHPTPQYHSGPEDTTRRPRAAMDCHDTSSASTADSMAKSPTRSMTGRELSRGQVLTINPADVEINPAYNIAWWMQDTDHRNLLSKLKPEQIEQAARAAMQYRKSRTGLVEFSSIWTKEKQAEQNELEKHAEPDVVSEQESITIDETQLLADLDEQLNKNKNTEDNNPKHSSPTATPLSLSPSTVVFQCSGTNKTAQAPKRPMTEAPESTPRKRSVLLGKRKAHAVPSSGLQSSPGTPSNVATPVAQVSSATPVRVLESRTVNHNRAQQLPLTDARFDKVSPKPTLTAPAKTNKTAEESEHMDWEATRPTKSFPNTSATAAQSKASFGGAGTHHTVGSNTPKRKPAAQPNTPGNLRGTPLAASVSGKIATAAGAKRLTAPPPRQTAKETPVRKSSDPATSPLNQTTSLQGILQHRQSPISTPVHNRTGMSSRPSSAVNGAIGQVGNRNMSRQVIAPLVSPDLEPRNHPRVQINQHTQFQKPDAFGPQSPHTPTMINSGLRNPELGNAMLIPASSPQTEGELFLEMQRQTQVRARAFHNLQQAAQAAGANPNASPAHLLGSNPQDDRLFEMRLSAQQLQNPRPMPAHNVVPVQQQERVTAGTPTRSFHMNRNPGRAQAVTFPSAGMSGEPSGYTSRMQDHEFRLHQMRIEAQRQAQLRQLAQSPGWTNGNHVTAPRVQAEPFSAGITTPTRNPALSLQHQAPAVSPQSDMSAMCPPAFMPQFASFPFLADPFVQSPRQNNTSHQSPPSMTGTGEAQRSRRSLGAAEEENPPQMYDFMPWD